MIDPPVLGRLLPWLARLALAVAVLAAVLLARRRAEYRPVAWLLCVLGVANLVRPVLFLLVLEPAIHEGRLPFQGSERLVFHVEQALFISWPFGVAALAVAQFISRRYWLIVAGAYVVAGVVLVVGYPTIRQDLLASVYLGLTVGCLVVALGGPAWWWRRRIPMSPPEIATFLLVVFLLATVLGPYAVARVDIGWSLGPGLFAGMYITLTAMEVAWLRRR